MLTFADEPSWYLRITSCVVNSLCTPSIMARRKFIWKDVRLSVCFSNSGVFWSMMSWKAASSSCRVASLPVRVHTSHASCCTYDEWLSTLRHISSASSAGMLFPVASKRLRM